MRILVVTNLYPPAAYGGYELSCRDVSVGWAARGHPVAVLTSDHRRPQGRAEPQGGVSVERALPLTWEHGEVPPRWRRPGIERRAGRMLAAAVERHRPDVISVWNPSGLPGSLLADLAGGGVPVVWVLADAWPERIVLGDPWLAPFRARPTAQRLVAAVTRRATELPDITATATVCCCSGNLRDRVGAATGWAMDATIVVPLGVSLADFPPSPVKAVEEWAWRLLYVGRLDAAKGVDTLVRALPLLPPETTLRIAGPEEPAHVARVTTLIQDLALDGRVSIASAPRSELASVYRAADVCVFPSEWAEPFGLVPLEAMASGTPVVATGTGGSGEYLTHDANALLFRAGDVDALASALWRLSTEAPLRETLRAGGTATANEFTVERLIDTLETVHREAMV